MVGLIKKMVYPYWVCVLKLSVLEIGVGVLRNNKKNDFIERYTGGGHVSGGGAGSLSQRFRN